MKNNTIYEKQSKQIGIPEKDLKYIYVNEKTKNKTEKELENINKIEDKINNSFLNNKYKKIIKEKLYFASYYGNIIIKENKIISTIKLENNMEYILKLDIKKQNIEISSVFKCKNEVTITNINSFKEENLSYINYEEKIINTNAPKSIKNLSSYECYDKNNNQIFGNYTKEKIIYKNKNKALLTKEESTLFKEKEKVYKKKSIGNKKRLYCQTYWKNAKMLI